MRDIYFAWFPLFIITNFTISSSATPTPTTSTTPIPRDDPIGWVCPENHKGLIRHPYFCQEFYLCNIRDEEPYSLECSSGLYFNPETNRCDFPLNVPDCQGGSPPPTSTTPAPSTPTDPISWACPGNYQGLIRHPYNCRLYYLCNVDPTPYLLECPSGLHFNPDTEYCDDPAAIPDCKGGSPSTTRMTLQPPITIKWINSSIQ